MTDRNRCSNGSLGCDFDSGITRVEELMQVVGSHYGDERLACPMCLRDSMLVVAALLHVEASRITALGLGTIANVADVLADTFASAACGKLRAVIGIGVPGVDHPIQ
jgi:hypothetical protein